MDSWVTQRGLKIPNLVSYYLWMLLNQDFQSKVFIIFSSMERSSQSLKSKKVCNNYKRLASWTLTCEVHGLFLGKCWILSFSNFPGALRINKSKHNGHSGHKGRKLGLSWCKGEIINKVGMKTNKVKYCLSEKMKNSILSQPNT